VVSVMGRMIVGWGGFPEVTSGAKALRPAASSARAGDAFFMDPCEFAYAAAESRVRRD